MMVAPLLWNFLGPRNGGVKSKLPNFSSGREHKSPPPNHVIDLQRLRSPASMNGEEGQRNRHPASDHGMEDDL